ncbi:MAG: hypothetical protein IPP97_27490 [Candidatus Obscuribacter sp.]|nr:hypothetical protein [Candidatus Obscuribacter sp.]MBL0189477.1 hypothetical protein [Candidatus Obscuribacter sp.]MBP6350010.1 hypothetical protein [Candidatus Obscuribacter sp.]
MTALTNNGKTMSYAFHIFLQNEPKLQDLLSNLTKLRLAVEHNPSAVPAEFAAFKEESIDVDGVSPNINVVGPCTTFAEEMPSFSTNDLDKCKWVVYANCDLEQETLDLASKFGSALVKTYKGALYDPQEDQLIFPKRVARKSEAQEIKLLSLEWFTSDEHFMPDKAARLLEILEEFCPQAQPMRYGRNLPFTNKLVNGGKDAFIGALRKEGSVRWRGRYPALGGAIWRPSEFTRTKSTESPCVTISLDFDCSWVTASSENSQQIVDLFTAISESLECFYGGCAVRRKVTMVDGEVFLGPDAENWSFGRSAYWDGIPVVKTWLTWFGAQYKEEVKDLLDHRFVSMEGSFMRLGDKPMDADELSYVFPKLPEHLLNAETSHGLFRKSML